MVLVLLARSMAAYHQIDDMKKDSRILPKNESVGGMEGNSQAQRSSQVDSVNKDQTPRRTANAY